jgi:hypothetical protein
MKTATYLLATLVLLLATAPTWSAQEVPAPNISGMAVQGVTVNLNYFRGDKNVLVVFYRMHN